VVVDLLKLHVSRRGKLQRNRERMTARGLNV
jgi:hypothetical protein